MRNLSHAGCLKISVKLSSMCVIWLKGRFDMKDTYCEHCYKDDALSSDDIIVDGDGNIIGYMYYCSECKESTESYF